MAGRATATTVSTNAQSGRRWRRTRKEVMTMINLRSQDAVQESVPRARSSPLSVIPQVVDAPGVSEPL